MIAQYPAHGLVEKNKVAGRIGFIIPVFNAFQDGAVFFLGKLEGFIDPLAFNGQGDLFGDREQDVDIFFCRIVLLYGSINILYNRIKF